MLDPTQSLERYARQLCLPEIGLAGQQRLAASRVLLVGMGGLGCPAAQYLAAAGVGHLGLIDPDGVALSNLHRQPLYHDADVGRPKVEVASEVLATQYPHLQFETWAQPLDASLADALFPQYDLILDGTDNFTARYCINDACMRHLRPCVYAALYRFEGQMTVFDPTAGTGCLRCLFPEPPAAGEVCNCAEAGVLGALPGMLGTMQAIETLKLLVDFGEPLRGRLLLFDALTMQSRTLNYARDSHCPACGTAKGEIAQPPTSEKQTSIASAPRQMTAATLRDRLQGDAPHSLVLLDVRERAEFDLDHLPGALWLPLHQLQAQLETLDPSAETVVYCQMGGRSAQAQAWLQEAGFSNVWNLAGGMLAWQAWGAHPS